MGAVPAAVVILTLLGLLILPLLQQPISVARAEIDGLADPARTQVTEIQYHLARQTSTRADF